MRKIRNLLVALIFLLPIPQYATTTVNLTPVPKEMTVQEGQLLLPEEIKINSGSLSAEMTTEVQNFATALRIATGRDYAFQSVKKMLPANMMAGKSDATVTEYALPLVTITDEPRFGYRGYMLDVSRHFFTVDEVKRMLDVMSYYKINRFHWHLTDDEN